MEKNMRKFILGFFSGIIILLAVIYVYMVSGMFNISVTTDHPVINSFLDMMKDRSINSRAVKMEINENNAGLLNGALYFMNTCVLCHGAPGFEKNDFAKSMIPSPPDLSDKENMADLDDGRLYLIINDGIHMTAMPAFGKFKNTNDVKDLVLMAKSLQNLKKQDIEKLIKTK
jgi:hypothetical protein